MSSPANSGIIFSELIELDVKFVASNANHSDGV